MNTQEAYELVDIPKNPSAVGIAGERSQKFLEAVDAGRAMKIEGLSKEKARSVVSTLSQFLSRNRPTHQMRSMKQGDGTLIVWGEPREQKLVTTS